MQGVNEEWLKQPKRKCDNCGKRYQPIRPIAGSKKGYCTRECKDQYHKAGGSYKRVEELFKGRLEKLESRIAALELRPPKA